MEKITVQVKEDHLALLARAKPMTAVAELVWNAFDAEATEVRVDFLQNDLDAVDALRIADNGHGLAYADALVVFQNLGGSWKREGMRTTRRKRLLHGKYGKGRFRAFALGNRVQWTSVYDDGGRRARYTITGNAEVPGEFLLSAPVDAGDAPTGVTVEISNLPGNTGLLQGTKALEEVTELFALYLRQYPDVRLVYDGVPLDPANAEDHIADVDLGEMVLATGERVHPQLTIVEWLAPGKRGLVLCDENGFALAPAKARILSRGFSYSAYLKSAYFSKLEAEGLLEIEDLAPDLQAILAEARAALRRHFALREAQVAQDVLARWRQAGLYPYPNGPEDSAEVLERRIFDIYASQLNRVPDFTEAGPRVKRLVLRLLKEVIHMQPVDVARILDDVLNLPPEEKETVEGLLES